MLTGIVKSAFHASHADGSSPAAVVQRVSRLGLAAFSPDRFVTLVAALISSGRTAVAVCERRSSADRSVGKQARTAVAREHRAAGVAGADSVDVGRTGGADRRGRSPLLYTDGVSETLADDDGRAEQRFTSTIARAAESGAPLLDAILADVDHELAGRPQPDDVTLLTATVRSLGE